MRLFSYIFLFLLTTWQLIAQTYPVQVVPMLTPPYSSKIADYANPMANRVQLQLITTDLSVQNRSVQLYVEIKGNGLTAASAPVLSGISPLRINGGEILRLTNAELASYFQLRNLQGITSQQYTSALPDGMYSFCFRIKDVLSGRWLSQSHCAIAYLMLNDPPILNIPTDNEQVAVTDFQNIIFSWTPRQINATNITYSFELREILDPALDPRFAFEVSRRILKEDDLRMTTFVYDVSKPNLIPGRRYAWRVRAISTGGLAENSVFKNDGYSEVHSFVYAVNCSKPLFLLSQQQGKNRTKLLWQGHTLHQKYHIQYRKKGVANAQWFEASTRNTQTLITDLEAGEYEFRVGATCETERYGINPSYVYSDIQTFKIEKTPNTTEQGYNCGIVPKITITNQKPLNSLITNEVFTAGDFAVTLLEVSGSNGVFSGKGFIKVPYLNDTKLAVEFENVKINSDYQLTDGVVKTTYDADWKNVQFIENLIGQGKKSNEINVPFEIEKVETRNGEIVVTGKDGRKEVFPFGGNDSSIKGKVTTTTNGVTTTQEKIYHIDKDGKVSEPQTVAQGGKPTKENTNGVSKNGEATALTAKGIEVTFENTADSKYAYEVPTKVYSKDYQKMDGKYIPFKAVVKGEAEPFLAKVHISDKNISADSLIFKTDKGALIESKRVEGSDDFLLTLKGFYSFAVEQVQATIKQGKKYQIAGVFNLVHLSPKTAKVTLIPTAENLTIDVEKVKAIYSKVGVTLDITWAAPFDISPYLTNGVLETKDVFGDLTDYSPSQQALINAYKATGKVANDTYYVFITNAKSSTGQGGYMALGGQFGFVFDQTERTLAHELGHGIFKLAHPFKKKQQGNVPSLMDYTSDEALLFADWKQINDPAFKVGIFQGQSEGAFAGGIWLTPDWKPFTFNKSHITSINRENILFIPYGALPGIFVNDKAYFAEFSSDGKFLGYINDGEILEISYPKVDKSTTIYLYRVGEHCGTNSYYSTTWKYINNKKGKVIFSDEQKEKNIIFIGTIPCRENEKNNDSICKKFTLISSDNLEDYQEKVSSSLKNALKNILLSKETITNIPKTYYHIQKIGDNTLNKPYLDPIEDKLHLLSHYTDIDVVVGILPISNNSYINERDLSNMAQKAIKEQKTSRKIVYILIASSDYESIFGVGTFNNDSCYTIGYAQSQEGILSNKIKGENIYEKLLSLYKGIEKPLYIHRFYIQGEGGILDIKETIKKVRGFKEIHSLQVYESVYYQKIKEIRAKIEQEYRKFFTFSENISIDFKKIHQLQEHLENVKQQSFIEESDLKAVHIWKHWEIVDKNILREVYILDNEISLAEIQRLRSNFKYFIEGIIYHGQDKVLNSSYYYDFKGADFVYLFADTLGVIPVIDIAGDIVGFLYATYRGDSFEMGIYATVMAIPVGGIYLKSTRDIEKYYVIVARQTDNGEVLLQAVTRKQRLSTDIDLTSTLTENYTDAQKALEEVKKYADIERIKTLVRTANALSKGADNILIKAFSQGSKFIDDTKTIEKITHYLAPENAEKLKAIGGEQGLINFLKKYKDAPCGNCGEAGRKIFGGRTIDEMLENYVEVAHTFRNRPDLWKKIEEGALSSNAAMREGTQHMLSTFKKNPKKYMPENIEHLDMKFEKGLDDICANCRYDVKFNNKQNPNLPLFEEFKSYNSETWSKIANDKGFIKQFESYLQEVDEIKDLAYVINSNKANINEVKQAFKELFKKEADNLFRFPEEGGLGLEKIRKLFGRDIKNTSDFLDKAEDINNPIYNFIKTN